MTFNLTVPNATHDQLVAAAKKILVTGITDSDGTVIRIKALTGSDVEVEVVKNAQNFPQSYFEIKARSKMQDLVKSLPPTPVVPQAGATFPADVKKSSEPGVRHQAVHGMTFPQTWKREGVPDRIAKNDSDAHKAKVDGFHLDVPSDQDQ
jgi:hypothetical protein